MAITAADINNQRFTEVKKNGYDVDEVDVFLEWVANEIDALNHEVATLQSKLDEASHAALASDSAAREASVNSASLDATVAERDARIASLERQLDEKRADESRISQALIIAQRSAEDIIAKANAQAGETIADSREEAQRILDRANADRQSVIDAIRKLQDDRADALEDYQSLLKNMIDDATRKLSDLSSYTTVDRVASMPSGESKHAAAPRSSSVYASYGAERIASSADAANYSTPQADATPVISAPEPRASVVDKDLSGYGDADDSFEFDEID